MNLLPKSLTLRVMLSFALASSLAGQAGAIEYGTVTLRQRPAAVDDGLAPMRTYSAADEARLASKRPQSRDAYLARHMSSYGAIAAGVVSRPVSDSGAMFAPASAPTSVYFVPSQMYPIGSTDVIVHGVGDTFTQSETAIAASPNGMVLIAGYNDGRGVSVTPLSASGISRSTNGGVTWDELPIGPGGLGVLPSVTNGSLFGDPDVKWSPGLNSGSGGFVYSSIYVRPVDGRQGVSISTSDATGATWSNPKEVTPSFISGDSGDKPLIDVNQSTGRILAAWTNFTASSSQILSTFSDDGGNTWSTAVAIATLPAASGSVQGAVPRFGPGVSNATAKAYVIFKQLTSTEAHSIMFSQSADGGATWSVPIATAATTFPAPDEVQGVDRTEVNPSMAVNLANGDIYIVYSRNNSVGTGDVAFQAALGGGSFSAPVLINADPGNDRTQFFPSVAVDQTSGAIHVFYYDMGSRTTGDILEVSYSRSTDRGVTFTSPTPLNDRPMHAGYGNDTNQPNLGDYNQGIAYNNVLHSLWGGTDKKPLFSDGQPAGALFGPDTYYDARAVAAAVLSVRAGVPELAEPACVSGTNGNIDPGETIDLAIPLENFAGNAVASATTLTGIAATLSSLTPGVSVVLADAAYPDLAPLATGTNSTPFEIVIDPSFVPGTDIELSLRVIAGGAAIDLPLTLASGSPATPTALINENFDGVTPPALPVGWSSIRGGTTSASSPLWVTNSTFTGSNAAFIGDLGSFRWIRLLSPVVVVPTPVAGAQSYVDVDFDLTYNLEDEPTTQVLAYDGLTLRITDQTVGQTVRSVLAEAFATEIKTGANDHFPKHLPRNNSTAYLDDNSVWSGYSNGTQHIHMRFPGQGMTGRSIQLRFEYTEDGGGKCSAAAPPAATCGAVVDNVVVNFVPLTSGACVLQPHGIGSAQPAIVNQGASTLLTVAVTPAQSPTSTNLAVQADLSGIGGSATQSFYDDGTHGDVTANDNIFTYSANVPVSVAPGPGIILPVSIGDGQARSATTQIGLSLTDIIFQTGLEGPVYSSANCLAVQNSLNIFWEAVRGSHAGCTGVEYTDGNPVQAAANGSFTMNGTSASNLACITPAKYQLAVSANKQTLSGADTLDVLPMTLTLSSDGACFVGHRISGGDDYVATIWNFAGP